jgi:hypothetical protein
MPRWIPIGLAAWRVGGFLATERGPWALADRLRKATPTMHPVILSGTGYREATEIDDADDMQWMELGGPRMEFGMMLRCVYCSSVWLAAGLVWADRHWPGLVDALAAAGLVSVIADTGHALGAIEASHAARVPGVDLGDGAD